MPDGMLAEGALVPATTDDGRVVVGLVPFESPGVTHERQRTTTGHTEALVHVDGVRVSDDNLLGGVDGGADVLDWTVERATAALCALAIGVCEEAVAADRRVHQDPGAVRAADRHLPGGRATGRRRLRRHRGGPAHRLAGGLAARRGLPAAAEVAVAKFWAADGGQRVVHAAQHLHGGVGVDRDYPLHRYFLLAKRLELTLGGTTPQLLTLGRILADEPVG